MDHDPPRIVSLTRERALTGRLIVSALLVIVLSLSAAVANARNVVDEVGRSIMSCALSSRHQHAPEAGLVGVLDQAGRGTARGRRAGIDPAALADRAGRRSAGDALGFFYLSNRHTLSTIFGRDPSARPALAARRA